MAGGEVGPEDQNSVVRSTLAKDRHDPERPAVSTAEAARLLGISRQGVIQAIHAGRLPGYALPGLKNSRWFVYRDAVDPAAAREKQLEDRASEMQRRLAATENALAVLRATQEQRRESQRLLTQALEKIQSANADLVAAYTKLAEIADAADDQSVGSWVQPFPAESV